MTESRLFGAVRKAEQALTRWYEHSTVHRIDTTFVRWTKRSFLYTWLTTEPEPEVIVIDLRETMTVGPVIRMLDRAADSWTRFYRGSSMERAVQEGTNRLRAAPIRVLSTIVLLGVSLDLAVAVRSGQTGQSELVVRLAIFGVAVLGTRILTSWDDIQDSRAWKLLLVILEPPEPPEEDN